MLGFCYQPGLYSCVRYKRCPKDFNRQIMASFNFPFPSSIQTKCPKGLCSELFLSISFWVHWKSEPHCDMFDISWHRKWTQKRNVQKKRIICNSIMGIRIRVGLIYWSVCSKKNGGVSDIQWDFSNTYNLPTYLPSSRWHTMQAARQRRTSFSTIFLILKRGGVWPNKENRAIEPYSFIVGPGGLL